MKRIHCIKSRVLSFILSAALVLGCWPISLVSAATVNDFDSLDAVPVTQTAGSTLSDIGYTEADLQTEDNVLYGFDYANNTIVETLSKGAFTLGLGSISSDGTETSAAVDFDYPDRIAKLFNGITDTNATNADIGLSQKFWSETTDESNNKVFRKRNDIFYDFTFRLDGSYELETLIFADAKNNNPNFFVTDYSIYISDSADTLFSSKPIVTKLSNSQRFNNFQLGGRTAEYIGIRVYSAGTEDLCKSLGANNAYVRATEIALFASPNSITDEHPDTTERDFDSNYAVAFNDFEAVSGYTPKSGFSIADTGNSVYGKAFKVPASYYAGLGAITSLNATYTWNGSIHNMFRESIITGEDYIFSYEYWSDPNPVAPEGKKVNTSTVFSMAPMHDAFSTSGGDYRYYPKYYSDDKWHLGAVAFTAGNSSDSSEEIGLNLKFNTCGSYIASYVDNYLIMKAGELSINDVSGTVSLEAISNDIIVSIADNAYNKKTTYPLGNTIKFRLNSPSDAVVIKSVKMGSKELVPDAYGIYKVKAIDDIVVEVEINTSKITEKYPVDGKGNIYFEDKLTTISFANSVGIPVSLFSVTRNGENLKNDVYISANDRVVIGSTTAYNVKYIGDVADGGDGKWTVSDVITTISKIVDNEQSDLPTIAFDMNKTDTVTVSDVVVLRRKILNAQETLSANPEVMAQMDAYVEDTLARSGTVATEQDLINGIYNYGDRTRIANVIRKAMKGEDIKIVYFGGSITHMGAQSPNAPFTNSITESEGYIGWVTNWFKNHFPDITVNIFNAGIGSTDTPLAIHRMVEDVLEKEPDLVINEWSMNDGPTIQYKQGTYEAVVKRLLENDIAVLLYAFAGSQGLTAEELHKPIADHYEVPLLSMKSAFFNLPNYAQLSNDTVHPNKVGHALTGINMAYYLLSIYENIDAIGEEPCDIPSSYYHHEAHYYEGAYMADLYDVWNGKVEGVKITEMGSFTWDETASGFGNNNFRSYIGASARYQDNYEPMVIEIDSAKTLFILNKVSEGFSDGAYYIEVNGEKMTSSEYNCSKGKKEDKNPESGYHWPTPLIRYDASASAVTLKIYPNITDTTDVNNRVTIYSLLLS